MENNIPSRKIVGLLLSKASFKISDAVIDALDNGNVNDSIKQLNEISESGDCDTRKYVKRAIEIIKDPFAARPIIEEIKNESGYERTAGIYLLGQMKCKDAVGFLLEEMHYPDADVIEAAAYAIGMINESEAVSPLLEYLKSGYFPTRAGACYVLGEMGDLDFVEVLTEAMEDTEGWVSKSAGRALAKIDHKSALYALINALKNGSDICRISAAKGLFGRKSSEAIGDLISALYDTNPEVRRICAEALDKFNDPDGNKVILECVLNGDAAVARGAFHMLISLGLDETIEVLLSVINGPYREQVAQCMRDAGLRDFDYINYMFHSGANCDLFAQYLIDSDHPAFDKTIREYLTSLNTMNVRDGRKHPKWGSGNVNGIKLKNH